MSDENENVLFTSGEITRDPGRFIGQTVTLAGKDPILWKETTITAVDDGHLVLSGGFQVTNLFAGEATYTPITEKNCRVPKWEIARGHIHREAEPQPAADANLE